MAATLTVMGKKKATTGDRHKPRRLVGLTPRIAAALEELAESRDTNLTEVVKTACIAYLESLGKWPPPAPKPAK